MITTWASICQGNLHNLSVCSFSLIAPEVLFWLHKMGKLSARTHWMPDWMLFSDRNCLRYVCGLPIISDVFWKTIRISNLLNVYGAHKNVMTEIFSNPFMTWLRSNSAPNPTLGAGGLFSL